MQGTTTVSRCVTHIRHWTFVTNIGLLMMCRKIIAAFCKNITKLKDETCLRIYDVYGVKTHCVPRGYINCNNISRTIQIKVFCIRIQTATILKLVHRLELSLNFNDINTRSRNKKQVIVTFRYHKK